MVADSIDSIVSPMHDIQDAPVQDNHSSLILLQICTLEKDTYMQLTIL